MEKELLNELHELNSSLAHLKKPPKEAFYSQENHVPSNYFDSLTEQVLLRLELEGEADTLLQLSKTKQQSKPDAPSQGYFESLNESVLLQLELENDTPLLASLPKKQVFAAQNGEKIDFENNYFETLQESVFAELTSKKQKNSAVALMLTEKATKPRFLRILSVGSAIAAILTGTLFYFNASSTIEQSPETEAKTSIFANISKAETDFYIKEHAYEIDENLLAEHIENIPLQKMMDVSHKDLEEYLSEIGGTIED